MPPLKKQGTQSFPEPAQQCEDIVRLLRTHGSSDNVAGMARYGISTHDTLGVPMPVLRRVARVHKRNHLLAALLWETGIHEARILASLVDDPSLVTLAQMKRWAGAFDSWDVCDQCCSNLFGCTAFAREAALAWSGDSRTFVKRAGFVLMARLALHGRDLDDACFSPFLDRIEEEAADGRVMVKKAISWALRQIGKRNKALCLKSLVVADRLRRQKEPAARWIGGDAWRELHGDTARRVIEKREARTHHRTNR